MVRKAQKTWSSPYFKEKFVDCGKFGTYATKTNVLGHGMDFRPKLESASKKSLLVRQKLEESRTRNDGAGQERGNLMTRSS